MSLTRTTLGRLAAYAAAPVAGVSVAFDTADWLQDGAGALSLDAGNLRYTNAGDDGVVNIVEVDSNGVSADCLVQVTVTAMVGGVSTGVGPAARQTQGGMPSEEAVYMTGSSLGTGNNGMVERVGGVNVQTDLSSETAWTLPTVLSLRLVGAIADGYDHDKALARQLTGLTADGPYAGWQKAGGGAGEYRQIGGYCRMAAGALTVTGPHLTPWRARVKDAGGNVLVQADAVDGVAELDFFAARIVFPDAVTIEIVNPVTLAVLSDLDGPLTASPTERIWGGDAWGFELPAPLTGYRFRIRDQSTEANPNGTTDVITATSLTAFASPYLCSAPFGDGQEIDLLTGDLRTGQYLVRVIDAVIGGSSSGGYDYVERFITSQLEDAEFRQQLLSRRAYVEITRDGGVTWEELLAGYITAIILGNAIAFDFHIGDTRRVEVNRRIFTWQETPGPLGISERDVFPKRSCLVGGPIIGGFLGRSDPGGDTWEFVAESVSGLNPDRTVLALVPKEGWLSFGTMDARYTRQPRDLQRSYVEVLQPYGVPGFGEFIAGVPFNPFSLEASTYYPNVSVFLEVGGNTYTGRLRHLVTYGQFFIYADFLTPPTLVEGDRVRARLVLNEVTPQAPLYVDAHPVDIVTDLYDTVGIAYDQASADAMKALLGPDLRYAIRITEPPKMLEFLTKSIFGPFGFSVRNSPAGEYEFVATRQLSSDSPAVTLPTASLRSADPPIFSLEEVTIVSSFRISYRVFSIATWRASDAMPIPPDLLVEATVPVIIQNSDQSVFSTREVAYEFAGMVHLAGSNQAYMGELLAAIATLGFDRYGRGAPTMEVEVLDGEPGSEAYVGDELFLDVASYPNRGYRIGESDVGPRIAQVVRRTETPSGPSLKLVDSGLALQPVTPAVTVAIAASTGAPRTVAQVTLTNAAAINATGVLTVAVEFATGGSEPTSHGALFARYAAPNVPTGAVALPAATPGTTVWVRARTEQVERRPSAWSAWEDVTLAAFDAPASIVLGDETAESIGVTWVPDDPDYWTDLFVAPGTTPPADWLPFLAGRFRPGTDRATVRGLAAATDYVIGVAHRDLVTSELTTVTSDTTSTASNATTLDTPLALGVIPIAQDAGEPQGVALALWAIDDGYDIEIERAEDVAGVPGPFTALARVPGATPVYRDPLPNDGVTRWYRIRHALPGSDPSPYTGATFAVPSALPLTITRSDVTPGLRTFLFNDTTDTVEVHWSGRGIIEVAVDEGAGFGAYSLPATSPITITKLITVSQWRFRSVINGLTVYQQVEIEANVAAVPSLDAVFATTVEGIACGTSWEVGAFWTTFSADDINYEIQVWNDITNTLLASGQTTADGDYTDVTGETGDLFDSGTLHERRYRIEIRRLSDNVLIDSLITNYVSVETGAPC